MSHQNSIQEPVIINISHIYKHFYITSTYHQAHLLNLKQTSIKILLDLLLHHCQFSFRNLSQLRFIRTPLSPQYGDLDYKTLNSLYLARTKTYLAILIESQNPYLSTISKTSYFTNTGAEHQKRLLKILVPCGVGSKLLQWKLAPLMQHSVPGELRPVQVSISFLFIKPYLMNLLVQLLVQERLARIYHFKCCRALLRLRALPLHKQHDRPKNQ